MKNYVFKNSSEVGWKKCKCSVSIQRRLSSNTENVWMMTKAEKAFPHVAVFMIEAYKSATTKNSLNDGCMYVDRCSEIWG